MNRDDIYQSIVKWESEHGESFLDQGFNLNELTFMTWCYGKNYISKDKYNHWVSAYLRNNIEAKDANYYVYGVSDYVGDDASAFAVVTSNEWNKVDQEQAYRILSEFISGIDVYIERFKKYINE